MKKVINRIKKYICTFALCGVITFSGIGSSYVSASTVALPTTYALWEMLLLTLGISVEASDNSLLEDICSDFLETYQLWWNDNFGEAAMADNKQFFTDVWDYYQSGALRIPLPVWLGLKAFVKDDVIPSYAVAPQGTMPYNQSCTYETFLDYMYDIYAVDEQAFTVIERHHYFEYVYDSFFGSGIFFKESASDGSYVSLKFVPLSASYSLKEIYKDGSANSEGATSTLGNIYGYFGGYDYSTLTYYGSGSKNTTLQTVFNNSDICALVINGYFYDFHSVFTPPVNSDNNSKEAGSKVDISTFAYAPPLSDKITSSANSAIGGSVTDAYVSDGYDVLTPGREWDEENKTVTGDVAIGIPSDDILEAYRKGTITWDELLEALDIHPVDTSTGKDIIADTTISESIDKVGDEIVTEVNITNVLLREVINSITDGFTRIKESVQSIFVIDTVAIDVALSGFDTVWEAKVPFAGAIDDMFDNFSFSEKYEYPVISMKTPDILKNFYAEDLIILCDFANYANYCVWCRNLVRALLWFSFGFSLLNHLKTNFNVG